MSDLITTSSLQAQLELDLSQIARQYHEAGLSYWQILKILSAYCVTLQMQVDAEYYLTH